VHAISFSKGARENDIIGARSQRIVAIVRRERPLESQSSAKDCTKELPNSGEDEKYRRWMWRFTLISVLAPPRPNP
jgi:hypothetical protein